MTADMSIPRALERYIADGNMNGFRLPPHDEKREDVCVLTIPQTDAGKEFETLLPPAVESGVKFSFSELKRMAFVVSGRPMDAGYALSLKSGCKAVFNGFGPKISVGTWDNEQPSELPNVPYASIAALFNVPVPEAPEPVEVKEPDEPAPVSAPVPAADEKPAQGMTEEEYRRLEESWLAELDDDDWDDDPDPVSTAPAADEKPAPEGLGKRVAESLPSPQAAEFLARMAAIPQAMRAAKQWLCWEYGERDGKKTKIPINPVTLTMTSAPDAAWSFDECRKVSEKTRGRGIGFSLKNGFIGIDYDHVLDEKGLLKPEHAALMDEIRALGSYTEVSPSGEGLHVFIQCLKIPDDCDAGKHTERGEIYSNGRFFTVTGDIWGDSPQP